MTEVELDEGSEDAAVGGPRPDRVPDGDAEQADAVAARRAALLRVLRRGWPVAVLVLLAVATWRTADGYRPAPDAAALRTTPGVLGAAVEPPLTAEPWVGGASVDVLWSGVVTADGRLAGLVGGDDEAGTRSVVLVDPRTGAEVWRTPVASHDGAQGSVATTCSGDRDPARVVWCAVATAPSEGAAVTTSVTAVDAGTGKPVVDRVLPSGTSAVVAGDTLVLVAAEAGGLELVGTGLADGAERWTTRVDGLRRLDRNALGFPVTAVRGHLLVRDGNRSWSVDPVDGRGTALTSGVPTAIEPDDGSVPEVEVLTMDDGTPGGRLRGVDGRTGDLLWDGPAREDLSGGLMLLDGVLYGADGTSVWAVDARTGADLWRTPAATTGALRAPLVTDGEVVLRTESPTGTEPAAGDTADPDDAPVLAAYRLRDGARVWEAPLPDGVQEVRATGGVLLGLGGTGVATLG